MKRRKTWRQDTTDDAKDRSKLDVVVRDKTFRLDVRLVL